MWLLFGFFVKIGLLLIPTSGPTDLPLELSQPTSDCLTTELFRYTGVYDLAR